MSSGKVWTKFLFSIFVVDYIEFPEFELDWLSTNLAQTTVLQTIVSFLFIRIFAFEGFFLYIDPHIKWNNPC